MTLETHTDAEPAETALAEIPRDAAVEEPRVPPPPEESAAEPEDARLRFSLGGMLGLFALLCLQLAVCTVVPWLLFVLPFATVAGVRTLLVANHRRRHGKSFTTGEGFELFMATLVFSGVYGLILSMILLAGFAFGSFVQVVMTRDANSYLLGGTLGMLAGGYVAVLGAWRSIHSNWIYDLRGPRSEVPKNVANGRVAGTRGLFRFNLLSMFELTTMAAFGALLGSAKIWLGVLWTIPGVASIIFSTIILNRLQQQGRPITSDIRYTIILRMFFLTAVAMLSVGVIAAGGAVAGWGLLDLLDLQVPQVIAVGSVLFALLGIIGWVRAVPSLLRDEERYWDAPDEEGNATNDAGIFANSHEPVR